MVVNVVLRYLLLKGLSQRLGEENEFRTTFTRALGARNHFPGLRPPCKSPSFASSISWSLTYPRDEANDDLHGENGRAKARCGS